MRKGLVVALIMLLAVCFGWSQEKKETEEAKKEQVQEKATPEQTQEKAGEQKEKKEKTAAEKMDAIEKKLGLEEESDEPKDPLQLYLKERRDTIAKLKEEKDPELEKILADLNKSRKRIRKRVKTLHNEIKTIKDPQEKYARVKQYYTEMIENEDRIAARFREQEWRLNEYLLQKNPKLKELYDQLPPEDKKLITAQKDKPEAGEDSSPTTEKPDKKE